MQQAELLSFSVLGRPNCCPVHHYSPSRSKLKSSNSNIITNKSNTIGNKSNISSNNGSNTNSTLSTSSDDTEGINNISNIDGNSAAFTAVSNVADIVGDSSMNVAAAGIIDSSNVAEPIDSGVTEVTDSNTEVIDSIGNPLTADVNSGITDGCGVATCGSGDIGSASVPAVSPVPEDLAAFRELQDKLHHTGHAVPIPTGEASYLAPPTLVWL